MTGKKIIEIFQEQDGKTSFGRVIGTILIIFYLIWATFLIYEKKELMDIPTNLMFLIASLYGFNKLREALKK